MRNAHLLTVTCSAREGPNTSDAYPSISRPPPLSPPIPLETDPPQVADPLDADLLLMQTPLDADSPPPRCRPSSRQIPMEGDPPG